MPNEGALTPAAVADGLGLGADRIIAAFAPDIREFDGAIQTALRTRRPALYLNKATRRNTPEEDAVRVLRSTGARSLITVPLAVGARIAGTVSFLERSRNAPYDAFDATCAVAAVRQLGTALEVVESLGRERDAIERSRLRGRATDQLFTTSNTGELLRRLTSVIAEDFADCAMAVSLRGADLEVLARAERNEIREGDARATSAAFGSVSESTLVDALRSRRPEISNRIARPRGGLLTAQVEKADVRSWMTVPLSAEEPMAGAIVCYSLRHRYTEEDLALLEEICRRTSLALDYARSFERERRLTRTLQQATLPSNLADIPGAVLSAIYIPAAQEEQVGGDWYDAFSLDDHRVLVTVGDVTGHGLQASVIMGKLRHALNVVAMYETNPAAVLDIAERIVLRRYPDAIATAFIAIVDTRSGTLTYANAGHPGSIVRLKDGSTLQLKAKGLPIGVRYLGGPSTHAVKELSSIDLLLMYTDGLTEANRLPIEGEAALRKAIANEVAIVVSDSASFVQAVCLDGPAPDDVAALSLNFATLRRWRFASDDFNAAQESRNEFRDGLRNSGLRNEDCAAAELVFGELCANVTRHAPGVAEVALDLRGEHAVLHVVDRGRGYRMRRTSDADVLSEAGRGLWLINRLGAKVSVTAIPRFGTHTRAILPGYLPT